MGKSLGHSKDCPLTAAEEAEALRLGLIGGYATLQQVVTWADQLILKDRAAEMPALLDLSLLSSESLAEAVALLRTIPGERSAPQVGRYVAGLIYEHMKLGTLSTERAARALFQAMLEGYAPDPEFESKAYSFDDGVDLALQGVYGTLQDVRAEMLGYLGQFAPAWG